MQDRSQTADQSFERAVAEGRVETFDYAGLMLQRCDDDVGHLPRGSVRTERGVLYGYPRIGRILMLRFGLSEQLRGRFHVDEKINGYNVRIAQVDGRLLAFTRGGLVCPFTTDRLPDLLDTAFFDAHPGRVLCAEVAGPENPWLDASPPFIDEDVRLFVFDVTAWNRPDFLPAEERDRLLSGFGLPAVPAFGWYDAGDYQRLARLALELHEQGREGLILRQESPRSLRLKHATASVTLEELARAATRLPDLPPDYVTQRLLRIALFLREHGLPATAHGAALGDALLGGLAHSLHELSARRHTGRPFRCRFRQRDNAERMVQLLHQISGHEVKIVIRGIEAEGGYWRLAFERRYPHTNGLLNLLPAGG